MKKKTISFIADSKIGYEVAPRPYPASQAIPKWWKDATPYHKTALDPEGKKLIVRNLESSVTFKKCTPMLDSLTAGYIIPLWADVTVEDQGDLPLINWRVRTGDVFEAHGEITREMAKDDGYYERAFKYNNRWHIKTPPGYSILITSPFGYPSPIFKPISAIIDTDKSNHDITLPVWIKRKFNGVVEKGTPIAQIIPFKRDDWESDFSSYDEDDMKIIIDRDIKATIVNNYLKNFWTKKSFK